jgi:hypothetical protein
LEIEIHPHAVERMVERGTSQDEVFETVKTGDTYPVKLGRVAFKKNFRYNREWRGEHYRVKQVEVVAVEEGDGLLVITVIVKYF